MRPLPQPIGRPAAEPNKPLYFTTAQRYEMNQYVAQFLCVLDRLPSAETHPDNIVEIYEPGERAGIPLGAAMPEQSDYRKRVFRKKDTVVYGMVFTGWEEIS